MTDEHIETTTDSDDAGTVTNQPPESKNNLKLIAAIAGVGFLIIVVLAYAIFWRRGTNKPAAAETPAATNTTGTVTFLMEQQWLVHLKLAKVEEQTVARRIGATGRVVPAANSQAMVAPPVSGIITGNLLPRVGQRVSQGQTIAVIQQKATSAEEAQVRAAQAQVEAQNAQIAVENARLEAERRGAAGEVETARVRLGLARKEAERARRLYAGKAMSERHVQTAEAELAATESSYNAAVRRRDALNSARTVPNSGIRVGSANARYALTAPLSGYVTKVHKSMGEQVNAGENVVEISNLDTVWIEAPIFERDLNRISGNVEATFTTAAYPGQEFKGVVLDVGAVIDEKTRAATVTFQVPNAGRALRIGMQADVRLDAGESVTAMMVPKEAILEHEGKKIVYILLSGEEFQRREVVVGDEFGGKVAILSGLEKDVRVVTQGAYQLKMQELNPASAGEHSHET